MDILISVSEALASYICILLIFFRELVISCYNKNHNIVEGKTRYYDTPDAKKTQMIIIYNPV